MTRFIALLAIVSGLILTHPAKADDTAQWCVRAKSDGLHLIQDITAKGFPTRELDETNTAIFLSVVKKHGFIDGVPNLPNTNMVLLINPGKLVWGLIFLDDKWCARLQLSWEDYELIMQVMKPKNI